MADGAVALYRIYELPWSTGTEDEAQFHRIARTSFVAALVLGVLFWLLPVPKPDPSVVQEVPKTLVRLVLEREAPKPPPPLPVVREEPKPEPKAPDPVVEQRVEKPPPKPEPVKQPEPDRTQQARDKARVAGLLPFASQLAALRDNTATAKLDQAQKVGAGASETRFEERSMITSRVGSASNGINTAALSRNTGGNGLAGRSTTQVESPVDDFGSAGGAAQRSGESNKASRSREEIERTFDKNKGAIYALYNRALRANPALQGKVVLRLTITPDGRVTACEIVSSEINDPELQQKLIQRVLLFEFEPRDVETITTTKPIDFFPA